MSLSFGFKNVVDVPAALELLQGHGFELDPMMTSREERADLRERQGAVRLLVEHDLSPDGLAVHEERQ